MYFNIWCFCIHWGPRRRGTVFFLHTHLSGLGNPQLFLKVIHEWTSRKIPLCDNTSVLATKAVFAHLFLGKFQLQTSAFCFWKKIRTTRNGPGCCGQDWRRKSQVTLDKNISELSTMRPGDILCFWPLKMNFRRQRKQVLKPPSQVFP